MLPDEKVKTGYTATLSLISYEGQLIWRAFSAILAANGSVVAATGVILKLFPDHKVISLLLSFLGFIICIAWFLVLRRQFAYYRYWFAWARHLEQKFLAPEVQIVSMGRIYSEGSSLDTDGLELPRFSWTARIFRVEWLMIVVIAVFVLLHGATFWAAITAP